MPTITFKVTPDEAEKLRVAARGAKQTVSEFVRMKIRGPAKKKINKSSLLKRCPLMGIDIFHGTPDMIPLATETVREMLADFP